MVYLICKTSPNLPASVDPVFGVMFDEAIYGAYLNEHLKTAHMPVFHVACSLDLIKRHWRVFSPDGCRFLVIGYECDINTGNAFPVLCDNANYGPWE